MSDPAPRLLFIPVSGPFGMGEYARSAAIARAVSARWPAACVHFMLSREAPYAAGTPFPATLLPSSATFHTAAVVERIRSWRPQVVLFDNAGRTAQLEAAQRAGARIIYISARARQRARAFRLRWMRLIDEHWIAYPEFIAGALGPIERLRQGLLRRPVLRYLDVILADGAPHQKDGALRARGDFVLMVPGGGTGHPGAMHACAEFFAAAQVIAATGVAVRYVGPAPHGVGAPACLQLSAALAQPELAALMRRAALVVVNGGSTLLQAIACGAACVAAPIAGDQRARIRRCVAAGAAVEASPTAADLEVRSLALLRDHAARIELERRAQGLQLADGIEVALSALRPYLGPA